MEKIEQVETKTPVAKKETKKETQAKFKDGIELTTKVDEGCLVVSVAGDSDEEQVKKDGTNFEKQIANHAGVTVTNIRDIAAATTIYGKAITQKVGDVVTEGYAKHKDVTSFAHESSYGTGSLKIYGEKVVTGNVNGKEYKTTGFTVKEVPAKIGEIAGIKERINKSIGNV